MRVIAASDFARTTIRNCPSGLNYGLSISISFKVLAGFRYPRHGARTGVCGGAASVKLENWGLSPLSQHHPAAVNGVIAGGEAPN